MEGAEKSTYLMVPTRSKYCSPDWQLIPPRGKGKITEET